LDDSTTSPAAIAGYPTTVETFVLGGLEIPMYVVCHLESVVDREALLREETMPDPPYWAHLWLGARALARHVAESLDCAGATVLDLGCGLGLPGLVAGRRGAEVWFVDREPAALEFARASARRNGLVDARFHAIDFTRPEAAGGLAARRFDVILGAEIVYDPAAYIPLANFLARHLACGGRLLLTDAFRSDASRCFEALASFGLRGERVRCREWEGGRLHGLFLWDFRWPGGAPRAG
jgi:predicted nicotinamide N-methyase